MLYVVLIVLATKEALDLWFHGSLLAGCKARTELWEGRRGELMGCRFCLAPWTALACFLLLLVGDCISIRLIGGLLQAPVYALACAKAAGLLNDWVKSWEDLPSTDLPEATKVNLETHDPEQPDPNSPTSTRGETGESAV